MFDEAGLGLTRCVQGAASARVPRRGWAQALKLVLVLIPVLTLVLVLMRMSVLMLAGVLLPLLADVLMLLFGDVLVLVVLLHLLLLLLDLALMPEAGTVFQG